ncbi:transposon ty3-G gag-pol polyprotein, partial [Tanacetum coccineum]
AFRGSNKLSPRFFGPYRVLGKVGPVAYRVEFPPGSLIYDVFHVSLLRKCVGPVTDPIPAAVDVPQTPQPECILDERVVQKRKYRPKTELLVKWVGCPREDATWETKWRFARSYPNFRLEDKAGVGPIAQPATSCQRLQGAFSSNRNPPQESTTVRGGLGQMRDNMQVSLNGEVIKAHVLDAQ